MFLLMAMQISLVARGEKIHGGQFAKGNRTGISKANARAEKLLQNEFLNWRGEHDQIDDVLVIGVKF